MTPHAFRRRIRWAIYGATIGILLGALVAIITGRAAEMIAPFLP